MKTPLFSAMLKQNELNFNRFHMPGHKGDLPFPLSECAYFDMTELTHTGSLYQNTEPFLEMEEDFSKWYQSGASLVSAGGSTLCIQTMLSLFCPIGSKVLISRNCHLSAVNTVALLDLCPVWMMADTPSGVKTAGKISAQKIEKMLTENPDAVAVYLTSPDYFGSIADIQEISAICKAFSVPLLVDNAHGAHLHFFNLHPMQNGATACCDSLHKTLPTITGAAMMHLKNSDKKLEARRFMSIYGSTSPSYLIMLSADLLLSKKEILKEEFLSLAKNIKVLKEKASEKGILATIGTVDPVRISLLFEEKERVKTLSLLENIKIEVEYISNCHIVLLLSPQSDLSAVLSLIEELPPLLISPSFPKEMEFNTSQSIRKAMFSPSKQVLAEDAIGMISAQVISTCPPGIPIVLPGEIITNSILENISGKSFLFVLQ